MKSNKQFYIAVLWTVIAVVIVAVLFISRRFFGEPARAQSGVHQVGVIRSASSPSNRRRIPPKRSVSADQFLLVTLNGLFITPTDQVIDSNAEIIKQLTTSVSRVIFLITMSPEQTEEQVHALIESAGIFAAGLPKHRLVVTSTAEGRIAVAREIQPVVFLDSDPKVVEEISGKVPEVVLMTRDALDKYLVEQFIGKDE